MGVAFPLERGLQRFTSLFLNALSLWDSPPRRPRLLLLRAPSVGALLALPPPVLAPRRTMCFHMVSAFKCFVARSAGLSAPATFSSPSASALTWSCSHRYRTLRCLNLPRPARRTIPIAALASVCTVHSTAVPKSASIVMRPRPWAAPFVRAQSSASALESATVACVLDHDFRQWLPQRIIPPLVLLHVVLQPAHSLSVKTWM